METMPLKNKEAAEGFYSGIKLVSEYMEKTYDKLFKNIIYPSHRDKRLLGMYLRSMAWMKTIAVLNDVKYFQAIVSGNRALLEIVVDIALLSHDKTDSSCWKMYWWEQSAKLKDAQSIVEYYKKTNQPIPDEYHSHLLFLNNNKKEIDEKRLELWPSKKNKPTHPKNRWTGQGGLFQDIEAVDKYFYGIIEKELGKSLTEFYKTEYSKMNWMVHGSALAGIRELSLDGFHDLCAISYKLCSDLAMLCTKIMFIDYDYFTHYPALKKRVERIEE